MLHRFTVLNLVLSVMVLAGCANSRGLSTEPTEKRSEAVASTPERFTRFFGWGNLRDEATAQMFQDLGVTDVTVRDEKQIELANRFGMKPYLPAGGKGRYAQKITEAQEQFQRQLNGDWLPPLEKNATAEQKQQRREEIAAYRRSIQYRWGDAPEAGSSPEEVLPQSILCFLGPDNLQLALDDIDQKARIPGLAGFSLDYIGYTNYRGCYCDACLGRLQAYLHQHQLKDTPANHDAFYLQELIDYNNALVRHVKAINPNLKVMAHIYPVFLPQPLYGNRLMIDFCGQTVAWYFPWDESKIRSYSRNVVGQQHRYHSGVRGIPFMGYYQESVDFPKKDAYRVELELRAILESGSDILMVYNINHVLRDLEVSAVFKKYCAPAVATEH